MGTSKTPAASAATAAAEARRAVEELRQLRLRKLDERDEIASRPAPLEAAKAAAEAGIDRLIAERLENLSTAALRRPGPGRPPHLGALSDGQLLTLAIVGSRDAIVNGLQGFLATQYASDLPEIADADRRRELGRLDAEIFDAEIAEEQLIRGLEGAGMPISRREDADPRAVLAHDDELG